MPIEAASNLPVHINGTFGLTDDRRSIKWPGVERQNDLTSKWNDLLVKDVLPSSYADLLLESMQVIGDDNFYKAWPVVETLRGTHWEDLLQPLFKDLFMSRVILSETVRKPGEWVLPTSAIYISQSIDRLEAVVERIMTSCGMKLAKVPNSVRSSFTFSNVKVKEVTPQFVRNSIHSNISSYKNIDSTDKLELFRYCLSDKVYTDLNELELLSLANGSFIAFQNPQAFYSVAGPVYLCTPECPRTLLPNLDHKLVDHSSDASLHRLLMCVASTNKTQLKVLSVNHVASLVDEAMPIQWKTLNIIHFPCNEQFPLDWFEIFWKWVSNKSLKYFSNKLVVPVQQAGFSATDHFSVIRLAQSQAVLYILGHQEITPEIMSSLTKYRVMCSTQSVFSYLSHQSLNSYIEKYSPENILCVICKNNLYGSIKLTLQESEFLRNVLAQGKTLDLTVLRNIKIFETCTNMQGYHFSVIDVLKQSVLKQCVIEPPNIQDLISILPDKILIFANDSVQLHLLGMMKIYAPTRGEFVVDLILPLIQNETIIGSHIDSVMTHVLDSYYSLSSFNSSITKAIKNLQFVKNSLGQRKCPLELFDPNNEALSSIFEGECLFPAEPYNTSNYLKILKGCGLRDFVSAQEILDLIFSISVDVSTSPQPVSDMKITRAKAIVNYMQTQEFKSRMSGSYIIDKSIYCSYLPFDTALLLLSEKRSWFPVQAISLSNYPSCLPWRGDGSMSHFVSLNDTTAVSCTSNSISPLLYGSQAYFTQPYIDTEMLIWLGSHEPNACLLPHFCEIISHKKDIPADTLLNLVSHVYSVK